VFDGFLGVAVGLRLVHMGRKGWGVLSTEGIAKGRFIAVYTGEVITHQEQLNREKATHNGVTYIIDSQIGPKSCHQIIDGAKLGNVARCFNHRSAALRRFGRLLALFAARCWRFSRHFSLAWRP
jgi:hypothetical protein